MVGGGGGRWGLLWWWRKFSGLEQGEPKQCLLCSHLLFAQNMIRREENEEGDEEEDEEEIIALKCGVLKSNFLKIFERNLLANAVRFDFKEYTSGLLCFALSLLILFVLASLNSIMPLLC